MNKLKWIKVRFSRVCPPSGDIQSLHAVAVADRGPEIHFHSFLRGKGMNELDYSTVIT